MIETLEAALAAELPAHMRAFARAYVEGRMPPPAPELATRPATLTAVRASDDPARRWALLRLIVPIVIESDPAVTAARRQPPSWPSLAVLAAARDDVARATFGCGAIQLLHRLYGVIGASAVEETWRMSAPIDGWHTAREAIDAAATWHAIATRFGARGGVRIERSDQAHPRAFVVEPEREVIVVVPYVIDTPAARFALLHELGHAVVALALPAGVPRVLDEAGAAYISRADDELAIAARRRRTSVAAVLDAVERRLPDVTGAPGTKPPWALWHDPGAQAAYVEAETIADRLSDDGFVEVLTAERARIDQRTQI